FYRTSLHTISYSNSMVGTLTSDTNRVYVVDDLAVPPLPKRLAEFFWNDRLPAYSTSLKSLVNQNTLRAYDLESGKLVWELPNRNQPGDLADTHFLGPPLVLDNRLYVLNENKGKVRLFCLDSKQGKIRWSLDLVTLAEPVTLDAVRRMQAVPISYGDNVLVCPTNAGILVGVDLVSCRVLWSNIYGTPKALPRPPNRLVRPFPVKPVVLFEWQSSL